MRTRFLLAFLLFAVLPSPVDAQGGITLESLSVSLWSEYDQPSMLVIYDIEIAAGTPLPAALDIRIPRDGNITAVAYLEGDDLLNTEYAGPVQDGNWQVVTIFIKEQAVYRIEYYQPLTRAGDERYFNYQWTGDYPIDNFRIEVQVPGDGTAVKSTPMLPFAPNQSFLTGSASVSDLKSGETYEMELRYSRASDETVFPPSSPQVTASEPITQNTAGRVTLNNLPYILGVVGLLLIVGAIYYFQHTNSPQTVKPRKRPRATQDNSAEVYCHECGARAHGEDRFCRTCGTKLRSG